MTRRPLLSGISFGNGLKREIFLEIHHKSLNSFVNRSLINNLGVLLSDTWKFRCLTALERATNSARRRRNASGRDSGPWWRHIRFAVGNDRSGGLWRSASDSGIKGQHHGAGVGRCLRLAGSGSTTWFWWDWGETTRKRNVAYFGPKITLAFSAVWKGRKRQNATIRLLCCRTTVPG